MKEDPLSNGDNAFLRLIEGGELGQDGIIGERHDLSLVTAGT